MLHIRAATALLLIAIIATTLIYLPVWAFQVLVLLAVLFALAEFYRLTLSVTRFYRLVALVVGMGVALCQTWRPADLPMDAVLMAATFLLAVTYLIYAPTLELYTTRWAIAVLGGLYISLTLPYLGWLRQLDHGRTLVTMMLAMVALSDTAAYSVGRTLGRHKLAPMTSPNKTVEGFIGGIFGSIGGILAVRWWLWPEFPLGVAIGLGLVIGIVAPLGDLIESAIKRGAQVKDSGQMLPGHGGMLDRCDAYLFSAPVVYYVVTWFVL